MLDDDRLIGLLDAASNLRRAGSIDAILEQLVAQVRLVVDATHVRATAEFAGRPIGAATHGAQAAGRVEEVSFALQAGSDRYGELVVCAGAGGVDAWQRAALVILSHGAACGIRDGLSLDTGDGSTGTMLAMVAHDIRGPLTSILGFAETLKARDDGTDQSRSHFLSTIAAQARRIARLVDNVHALQRDRGRFSAARAPVPVARIIDEAISEVDVAEVGEGTHFEVVAPDDLEANVDGMLLYQALANLAWNSITHGRPPVRIEAAVDGGALQVSVHDSGPGIPAERQDSLFSPFAKGAIGTGLGLSIVAAVASAHGGSAWYDADASSGARFVLDLPMEEREVGQRPPAHA